MGDTEIKPYKQWKGWFKELRNNEDLKRTHKHNKEQIPVQLLPSPSYPLIQRQTYDPSVLVHKALGSQSLRSSLAHSSLSKMRQNIDLVDGQRQPPPAGTFQQNESRGRCLTFVTALVFAHFVMIQETWISQGRCFKIHVQYRCLFNFNPTFTAPKLKF